MSVKVTQKEIARRAGVSQAAVSLILKGRTDIALSREVRERVQRIAGSLSYTPPRRKTHNLALLLPPKNFWKIEQPDVYESRFFRGLIEGSERFGYHVLLESSEDDGTVPEAVSSHKVDGVILRGTRVRGYPAKIAALVPVVLLNHQDADADVPSVMPNNAEGVRKAIHRLTAAGHRRIAFFAAGKPDSIHQEERYDAYRKTLAELNLGPEEPYVRITAGRPANDDALESRMGEIVDYFLGLPEPPTAALSYGDVYVLPFMRCAQARGWRVPEDLSLIGFDNTVSCKNSHPSLTSIEQPMEAMAAAAVEELVKRLRHPEAPVRHLRFALTLAERESVAQVPVTTTQRPKAPGMPRY